MTQEPNKEVDHADALSAMAAGADLNEPDAYVQQQTQAQRTLEGLPPEQEQVQATPAAPTMDAFAAAASTTSGNAAARAIADRARLQASQAAAAAIQYKKFMVPLLLVVGLLLVGMGLLPWFYDPIAESAKAAAESGSVPPADWQFTVMNIVKYCAIPMGLILVVGSAYFHMDVQRIQRQRMAGR